MFGGGVLALGKGALAVLGDGLRVGVGGLLGEQGVTKKNYREDGREEFCWG